jgi:hypothetical protein
VSIGTVRADLAAADSRLSSTNLAASNAALERFAGLVRFSAEIQPQLVRADSLPATALTWLLIVPGAVLALAGIAGQLGWRRRAISLRD